jgi:hypothetical protein
MQPPCYAPSPAGASPQLSPETLEAICAVAFDVEQDRTSNDDRRWFKKNKRKKQRLRRAGPAEKLIDDAVTMVLVTQLAPGVRVRSGMQIEDEVLQGVMLEAGPERLVFRDGWVFVKPEWMP